MYVCQWHLDVPFGKQGDAVAVMREWGADKFEASAFRRAAGARLMVGHLGVSPSHVVDEYLFASLADFEAALAGMGTPQFRRHAERLAPHIVPGTQQWRVLRLVAERGGEGAA